nr:EOG090X09XM [Triops cancriformis]
MRRRTGVGAIRNQQLQSERFKDKGTELQETQFEHMTKQMEIFKEKLEDFAAKHRQEIKRSPIFRRQFQDMCATIGVDPLASSKGFWTELLGVGDFYYELAVQVVEVCLATSHRNGGLITLDELRHRLIQARGKAQHHQEITQDDLLRAIKKLKVLGSGFESIPLDKGCWLIKAVPGELSMDHTAILQTAQEEGCTTVGKLNKELGWDAIRASTALEQLLKDGVAWLDAQNPGENAYWFPSLFPALLQEE